MKNAQNKRISTFDALLFVVTDIFDLAKVHTELIVENINNLRHSQ